MLLISWYCLIEICKVYQFDPNIASYHKKFWNNIQVCTDQNQTSKPRIDFKR
nr:MAG TPA: hypothetical protein [Bacteriophage sp.]